MKNHLNIYIVLSIIILITLCFSTGSAQKFSFYEKNKEQLDNGDTIKLRSISPSMCVIFDLYQVCKKNDSTLLIYRIVSPCMQIINHKGMLANAHYDTFYMPPYEELPVAPYSIEVPLNYYHPFTGRLTDGTGLISLIGTRRKTKDNEFLPIKPYVKYNMNLFEIIKFIHETEEVYELIYYMKNGSLGLFNKADYNNILMQKKYGSNATFYINHMWGVYITEHFIVVLENIENGLQIGNYQEKDLRETFIKIAESIRPIDPNHFNINEIDEYKKIYEHQILSNKDQ